MHAAACPQLCSNGGEWAPRAIRRKVLLRAQMRAGGAPTEVCIRDISARGLLIQASRPPPRGGYIEIVSAGHAIVGRVVWAKERRFGVSTSDPIDVAALALQLPPATIASVRAPARVAPSARRASWDGHRAFGRAAQFAAVAVLAALLVTALAAAVFDTLATPLSRVSAQLGGNGAAAGGKGR